MYPCIMNKLSCINIWDSVLQNHLCDKQKKCNARIKCMAKKTTQKGDFAGHCPFIDYNIIKPEIVTCYKGEMILGSGGFCNCKRVWAN